MKPTLKAVAGEASYQLKNDAVEAYVTRTGGHLAPVHFKLGKRTVQPFQIVPWSQETMPKGTPTIVRLLRGDFFCMPFGGNDGLLRGEKHPVHGETANNVWASAKLVTDGPSTTLSLGMNTRARKGRVEKSLTLVEGHTAIYQRHVISGMSGAMNLGHHATLAFPDKPGSGLISTSAIKFGMVPPLPVENPEDKGYQSLLPGHTFKRLDRVKLLTGDFTDLSRYPARRGFEDIAMLANRPGGPFAWTAVSFPDEGYVWVALKDPNVLASTVMWHSNGGRHYGPWSGRHINALGLEEVTACFHWGVKESTGKNVINAKGHPTSLKLSPKKPLVINYIIAMAAIPKGFDHVKTIRPTKGKRDRVTLTSRSGKTVEAPLNHKFLYES